MNKSSLSAGRKLKPTKGDDEEVTRGGAITFRKARLNKGELYLVKCKCNYILKQELVQFAESYKPSFFIFISKIGQNNDNDCFISQTWFEF